jgi:hypothetical protein
MSKEVYIKPTVKSEILEPDALACAGSSGGYNPARVSWGKFMSNSTCCDKDIC